MQIKLNCKKITNNFLDNLLKERGIEDLQEFFNPSEKNVNPLENLDNMKEGFNLLMENINKNILLIVDSDCDGYTSSAIIYLYIKKICPDSNIEFKIHSAKQHGLQDHMEDIFNSNKNYDLIILPDSSSNDYIYHEKLKEINAKCLVLDHHLLDNDISDNIVLINNQTSNNYTNKDLTGAGVAFRFCQYCDKQLNKNFSENLIDLAALGIIGDMGSVVNLENKYLIKKGLSNIQNSFFKALLEHQAYSMKNKVNIINIQFYIVPLINAMVRFGSQEEKENMFLAFINGEEKVDSTKRGAKGTKEKLSIEMARICTNVKNRQDKTKANMVDLLEGKIYTEDLLANKLLILELDNDYDFVSTLNGLVAMELSKKFNKPTLIGRIGKDNIIRGSGRGLNESKLSNFKKYLEDTKMFEFAAGHPNAFGFGIKEQSLDKFISLSNKQLKDYDFNENYCFVDFDRDFSRDKNDIKEIIFSLENFSDWGEGNPEPLIAIRNLQITEHDLTMMKKNTVKLLSNEGITIIKFGGLEFYNTLMDYFKDNDVCTLDIVGRGTVNRYNGWETPQLLLTNYEIKKDNKYTLVF